MSSPLTLHQLPPEIFEEILAECGYEKGALDALALTCRALSIRTRPHRFPAITLHDNNFDDFIKLTCLVQWNTIIPSIKRLALGTKMFPLSHCHLNKLQSELGRNLDLTDWAVQFSRLWMLDLRGVYWSELPSCVTPALLCLQVEHLIVCLGKRALEIEDLKNTVVPTMRPRTLTISGPLWAQKSIPSLPPYIHEDSPFYIHYMQLDEKSPIHGLVDWLKGCSLPPSVIHLYIELPQDQCSPFGLGLVEILRLMSPVHLRLSLRSMIQPCFEFPVEAFGNLKTLQISSIYNDVVLASLASFLPDVGEMTDITVTSSLLRQFSVLQDHLKDIQLDSICSHTNIVFGNIPEILLTLYPNLESLNLTLRSGKDTRRTQLDAWLDQSPFSSLKARRVEVRIEAMGSDPAFLSPRTMLR